LSCQVPKPRAGMAAPVFNFCTVGDIFQIYESLENCFNGLKKGYLRSHCFAKLYSINRLMTTSFYICPIKPLLTWLEYLNY
jgi:hypothetical protein